MNFKTSKILPVLSFLFVLLSVPRLHRCSSLVPLYHLCMDQACIFTARLSLKSTKIFSYRLVLATRFWWEERPKLCVETMIFVLSFDIALHVRIFDVCAVPRPLSIAALQSMMRSVFLFCDVHKTNAREPGTHNTPPPLESTFLRYRATVACPSVRHH